MKNHIKLLLAVGVILNIIAYIFSKNIACFNGAGFLAVMLWIEITKEELLKK